MGLRTLIAWEYPEDDYDDTNAVFYFFDSVTGRVVGPGFNYGECENFEAYIVEAERVMEPLQPYDLRFFSEHEWDAHVITWTVWRTSLCARCGEHVKERSTSPAGLCKVGGYQAPQYLCLRHVPTNDEGVPLADVGDEHLNAPVIDINRDGDRS